MASIYTKEQLVSLYKPFTVDQVPNSKFFVTLIQKHPNIFKSYHNQPVAYYKEKEIKGFNQDVLVYSSNQNTPLKTVGVQQTDQFSFEDKLFTPQPKQTVSFEFEPPNPNPKEYKPLFSFSRLMRFGNLNDRSWYYIDDENVVQGPFTTIEMDCWYIKGFFAESLLISYKSKHPEGFMKLENLRENKFMKEEKQIFKSVRRWSAPFILTKKETQVIVKGPQTTKVKSEKEEIFNFGDSDQKKVQTNDNELEAGEVTVIAKVLNLPIKKKNKNQKN